MRIKSMLLRSCLVFLIVTACQDLQAAGMQKIPVEKFETTALWDIQHTDANGTPKGPPVATHPDWRGVLALYTDGTGMYRLDWDVKNSWVRPVLLFDRNVGLISLSGENIVDKGEVIVSVSGESIFIKIVKAVRASNGQTGAAAGCCFVSVPGNWIRLGLKK